MGWAVSAEIYDCRSLFHAKRALQAPRATVYAVVMLENISVGELMHHLKHAPLRLDTMHGHSVIKPATPPIPPPDAA